VDTTHPPATPVRATPDEPVDPAAASSSAKAPELKPDAPTPPTLRALLRYKLDKHTPPYVNVLATKVRVG
jgi:hypothetical protein